MALVSTSVILTDGDEPEPRLFLLFCSLSYRLQLAMSAGSRRLLFLMAVTTWKLEQRRERAAIGHL